MVDLTEADGEHRYVLVGETQVHVQRVGDHPGTVVLIHGGGPGASSWSNFEGNVPALREHYSLLLLDLPGYGSSGPARQEPGSSAFGYYADIVGAVLDAYEVPVAHLIGNSLGGGVSFRFAEAYPERVGRMVLLGPAGVCYPVWSPSGRIHSHLGEVSGALLREPTPDTMRAFLEEMVYDRSLVRDDVIAERLEHLAAAAADPEPGSPIFDMWLDAKDRVVKFNPLDFESWRLCPRVTTETLLVWGRDDHFNPVDGALYPLQYMPNAELQVFGRCGHWAQVEHREAFDAAVLEFLGRPAA